MARKVARIQARVGAEHAQSPRPVQQHLLTLRALLGELALTRAPCTTRSGPVLYTTAAGPGRRAL